MTQPSISGMLAGRRRLSSTAIIPMESMPWHGRPMEHALPRQATTGQYRSGRPFDHFDCPNMSGNYVQVSLCHIPIGVCFDQVQQFLYSKGFAQHVYPWEAGAYLFELAFTRCRYDDDWERLRGNSTVEVVDDGRTGQHARKQEVNDHQIVGRRFVLIAIEEEPLHERVTEDMRIDLVPGDLQRSCQVVADGMVVLEQSDLHPDDFLSRGFYSLPGLTIADRPVKVNAARLTAIALVVSS